MSKIPTPGQFYVSQHSTEHKKIVYSETSEGRIMREVWDADRHFPKRISADRVTTEVFEEVPLHCRPKEWNVKKAVVWLDQNGFQIFSLGRGLISFDVSRFREAKKRKLKVERERAAKHQFWESVKKELGIDAFGDVFSDVTFYDGWKDRVIEVIPLDNRLLLRVSSNGDTDFDLGDSFRLSFLQFSEDKRRKPKIKSFTFEKSVWKNKPDAKLEIKYEKYRINIEREDIECDRRYKNTVLFEALHTTQIVVSVFNLETQKETVHRISPLLKKWDRSFVQLANGFAKAQKKQVIVRLGEKQYKISANRPRLLGKISDDFLVFSTFSVVRKDAENLIRFAFDRYCKIIVWSLTEKKKYRELGGQTYKYFLCEVQPGRCLLAVGGSKGQYEKNILWDIRNNKILAEFDAKTFITNNPKAALPMSVDWVESFHDHTLFQSDTGLFSLRCTADQKYELEFVSENTFVRGKLNDKTILLEKEGLSILDGESLIRIDSLSGHRQAVNYLVQLHDGTIYSDSQSGACFALWRRGEAHVPLRSHGSEEFNPRVPLPVESHPPLTVMDFPEIEDCMARTFTQFGREYGSDPHSFFDRFSPTQKLQFEEHVMHEVKLLLDRELERIFSFKIDDQVAVTISKRQETFSRELQRVDQELRSIAVEHNAMYGDFEMKRAVLLEQENLRRHGSTKVFYETIELELSAKLFGPMIYRGGFLGREDVGWDTFAEAAGKLTGDLFKTLSFVAAFGTFGTSLILEPVVGITAEMGVERAIKKPVDIRFKKRAKNVSKAMGNFQDAMFLSELVARGLTKQHLAYLQTMSPQEAHHAAMNAVNFMYTFIASGGFQKKLEKSGASDELIGLKVQLLLGAVNEEALKSKKRFRFFGRKRGVIFREPLKTSPKPSVEENRHKNDPKIDDLAALNGRIRQLEQKVASLQTK